MMNPAEGAPGMACPYSKFALGRTAGIARRPESKIVLFTQRWVMAALLFSRVDTSEVALCDMTSLGGDLIFSGAS